MQQRGFNVVGKRNPRVVRNPHDSKWWWWWKWWKRWWWGWLMMKMMMIAIQIMTEKKNQRFLEKLSAVKHQCVEQNHSLITMMTMSLKEFTVIIVMHQLLRLPPWLTQIQHCPVVRNTPKQTPPWNDNDDEDWNSNTKVWCIHPHCTYQTHSLRSSFTLRGVRHSRSSANISLHSPAAALAKEVQISQQPASRTPTDRFP